MIAVVAIVVTGAYLIVLGVLVLSAPRDASGQVRLAAKHGHDANDSNCTYWRGDFSGVNLSAQCPKCSRKR